MECPECGASGPEVYPVWTDNPVASCEAGDPPDWCGCTVCNTMTPVD